MEILQTSGQKDGMIEDRKEQKYFLKDKNVKDGNA